MAGLEPGSTEHGSADYTRGVVVEVIESRDGEAFFVEPGHTDEFVDQLIRKSKQEHIVQNCPKDSAERFSSRQAFERWLQKDGGRSPYFLADASGEVAGLVWYGLKELDEGVMPDFPPEYIPNHTFAIRIYDGFDGRGLAKSLVRASMRDYLEQLGRSGQLEEFNGFHLETDTDNHAALRLYDSIGYKTVDEDEGKERFTMVLMREDAQNFAGVPIE